MYTAVRGRADHCDIIKLCVQSLDLTKTNQQFGICCEETTNKSPVHMKVLLGVGRSIGQRLHRQFAEASEDEEGVLLQDVREDADRLDAVAALLLRRRDACSRARLVKSLR